MYMIIRIRFDPYYQINISILSPFFRMSVYDAFLPFKVISGILFLGMSKSTVLNISTNIYCCLPVRIFFIAVYVYVKVFFIGDRFNFVSVFYHIIIIYNHIINSDFR